MPGQDKRNPAKSRDRSADRHTSNPLTVRLWPGDRERLEDYASRRGVPVGRMVAEAVREKLDREEAPAEGLR